MINDDKTKKKYTLVKCQLEKSHNSSLVEDEVAFFTWKKKTEVILINIFGKESRQLKDFQTAADSRYIPIHGLLSKQAQEAKGRNDRERAVKQGQAFLKVILFEIETSSIPEPQDSTTQPLGVFIAHGGTTPALNKVCEFLEALNVKAIVAEQEPSEARSVNNQVEWCMDQSACAIVLATADDKLEDGNTYPLLNVLNEIGRIEEQFPNQVIYLLENGASLPSNISEKIYERFTQNNMGKAFTKIAKELTRFGVIKPRSGMEKNV